MATTASSPLATHPMHGWKFNAPAGQSRNQFFVTQIGNRKACAFLRYDIVAPPVLAAETAVKLPAVSVYSINAGAVDGVSIGYLLWSPLVMTVDPFFALFRRPQFEPHTAAKEGAESHNRYQLKGGINVFVMNDDALMFTFHTQSKITQILES